MKRCPFHAGQRVRYKGTKTKKYGIVMSNNWFTIGAPMNCKIPGGPLVIEGYVAIRWNINGKAYLCTDKASELETF